LLAPTTGLCAKSPGCSISKAMLASVGLPPRYAFTEAAGADFSI
jgi:hypothetical protein